jgi:hypothetical protein
MRKVAQFLHVASRVLAIGAILAGIGVGFLEATIGPSFVCFDSCPTRGEMFPNVGPGAALQALLPCIVLELLALGAFVAYCLATGQARRVVLPIFFLLVGGLLAVAGLDALRQHVATTIPVDQNGIVIAEAAQAWATWVGLAVVLVAGTWSGVLAYLQWRR